MLFLMIYAIIPSYHSLVKVLVDPNKLFKLTDLGFTKLI